MKHASASVLDIEKLSNQAGAALLRDNGIWGTDKELNAAAHDFGGHPLALTLLSTFLKEKHVGDVRRRDAIRPLASDAADANHDLAKRVLESYAKEWLSERPEQQSIMYLVGLFDRPANADCLVALRAKPVIKGLTEPIVNLNKQGWLRAVARLREVKLLAPFDDGAPDTLDAHPLVRDWFGEQLQQRNPIAWKKANRRLYRHLRDTTEEGRRPTFEDLGPLYQAIIHGCRAGQHKETLHDIYIDRICRKFPDDSIEYYAFNQLGATGANLAALSWFFEPPFVKAIATLSSAERSFVLGEAALALAAQGHLSESRYCEHVVLRMDEAASDWGTATITAINLTATEMLLGNVAAALEAAQEAVEYAHRSPDEYATIDSLATLASVLHAAGDLELAKRRFEESESQQRRVSPTMPFSFFARGYWYCDLLLSLGDAASVLDRATRTRAWTRSENRRFVALDTLSIARARIALGLRVKLPAQTDAAVNHVQIGLATMDEAVDALRAAGHRGDSPRGLLARAALRRSAGDWDGATHDLDEAEEIAEPGPMRLYLCDMALERARLAFAQIEAFAPLNGMLEKDNPPKHEVPSAEKIAELKQGAAKQLGIAVEYIEKCGYHRRDEELAELQAVLRGEKTFAELPPRV